MAEDEAREAEALCPPERITCRKSCKPLPILNSSIRFMLKLSSSTSGCISIDSVRQETASGEEITSSSVLFVDGNGMQVRLEDLSDGYRSILSMTFELIRQLALAYGPERVFDPQDPTRVACPGVVLIDEIDIHLHPTWQRQIGLFLRQHFPKIQFIVTTHSPLICQAADAGTVFRLPRPGESGGGMVRGSQLRRLLYGDVLDAYGTEVFGRDIGRSDTAKEGRRRLAQLNVKEIREGLTDAERREQERLRGQMPTAALDQEAKDDPHS
jgi:hypothetical protein